MSKKLEGNGLFDSSRMIIPQHKEAAILQAQEIHRRKKTNLDEQQWEEVERALSESIREHVPVSIQVFGAFENREVIGMVTRVDTYRKEVKICYEDDWEWVKFKDIIAADV